jgi:CDP-diglyceride synthetase
MAWVLLLLPELTRLVLVSLLLHRLVILFLETGSLTTILPYDVLFIYFCLLLWPCILAGHFVFIWDVQTLAIVYMTFVVYGWFWFSFMVMCMDMCMDVFGYVFGYVFGVMCMGLCVWIPGLDLPRGLVQ